MRSSEFFHIDPSDPASLIRLMDEYGPGMSCFCGHNDKGERITALVTTTAIEISTAQENGWWRHNTYHRDGTTEETFDGKWR